MKANFYLNPLFLLLPFLFTADLTSNMYREATSLSSVKEIPGSPAKRKKIEGRLIIEDREAIYDGKPKSATIKTEPQGLKTITLYVKDGTIYQEAPTEPGRYMMVVVINDPASEATTISDSFVIL